MANLVFSAARALVVEKSLTRTIVRRALQDIDLKNIEELNELPAADDAMVDLKQFDLIVMNVTEDDQSGIAFAADIRRRRRPCNPFTAMILTCGSSEPAMIQAALNSGTDALLLKPYSPKQVQDQVMALAERRRPFVVTADYVGPDRRQGPRDDASEIPNFVVPNTLRDAATGNRPDDTADRIEQTWSSIDKELTLRLVFQILFLLRLMRASAGDPALAPARRELARLPAHVKATVERLRETSQREVGTTLLGWLSSYPKLTEKVARQTSLESAERSATALLGLLGNAKSPADLIAEADRALAKFRERLLAASVRRDAV